MRRNPGHNKLHHCVPQPASKKELLEASASAPYPAHPFSFFFRFPGAVLRSKFRARFRNRFLGPKLYLCFISYLVCHFVAETGAKKRSAFRDRFFSFFFFPAPFFLGAPTGSKKASQSQLRRPPAQGWECSVCCCSRRLRRQYDEERLSMFLCLSNEKSCFLAASFQRTVRPCVFLVARSLMLSQCRAALGDLTPGFLISLSSFLISIFLLTCLSFSEVGLLGSAWTAKRVGPLRHQTD